MVSPECVGNDLIGFHVNYFNLFCTTPKPCFDWLKFRGCCVLAGVIPNHFSKRASRHAMRNCFVKYKCDNNLEDARKSTYIIQRQARNIIIGHQSRDKLCPHFICRICLTLLKIRCNGGLQACTTPTFVTFIFAVLSKIWSFDLLASHVFLKGTMCCIIWRQYKLSRAVRLWSSKCLEVKGLYSFLFIKI